MKIIKFILVLAACLLSQGCVGVLVFSKGSTTIKNPSVEMAASVEGVRNGCNSVEYTSTWLKSNWGTPNSVKTISNTEELWTYEFKHQCWCGAMPMFIIPIPLMVPTGTEKVTFLLHDDRIVSAKQVKQRASGVGGGISAEGWRRF